MYFINTKYIYLMFSKHNTLLHIIKFFFFFLNLFSSNNSWHNFNTNFNIIGSILYLLFTTYYIWGIKYLIVLSVLCF